MLKHLYIENYALIRRLNIDLNPGFTVITGETGAGKSILLGALALILGQRADTTSLMDDSIKCIIEGHFDIEDYGLKNFFDRNELDYEKRSILRREILPSGKSRAFINDTPVNLQTMKSLGSLLVDIHSQHKTLILSEKKFQLAVIDQYAGHHKLLNEYKENYKAYTRLQDELKALREKEISVKADFDYLSFLLNELEEAKLISGEQEEAEEKLNTQTHAEEIKTALYRTAATFNDHESGIINALTDVLSELYKLSAYHEKISEIHKRINSNFIDLKDIGEEVEKLNEEIQYDANEIEILGNRLDLIYRLQQKHHANTIDELIKLKTVLQEKIDGIGSLEEVIDKKTKEAAFYQKAFDEKAKILSKNRKEVASDIEESMQELLQQLGMPDARFRILYNEATEPGPVGYDRIEFLFNANRGGELAEISRIASGGELSRLMLSVKSLISLRNLLPTIIFDEIDMGISGLIAGKMGEIMQRMSENMQVVAITHLPQIAGKGKQHFRVFKKTEQEKTRTYLQELSEDERINEIAKMLSNENVTESAVATAKELFKK